MTITVQCPNPDCQANYTVAESYSNRTVKCKKCGTRFVARATLDERATDTRPSAATGTETFSSFPAEFGRYRILKLLGRGGMGSVYLAEDSTLGRRVALKIPSFNTGESRQRAARFVREARSAAVLHHANVCTVFDAGEIEGRPFISMAFIDGKPLDAFIDAQPMMPERQAAEFVRKIAIGLSHAHRKGIVHRDLKPANVIIDSDGEPVITDFGLAKRVSEVDPNESKLTKDGSLLGTPTYMSPEQVRGEVNRIGAATDIYALGVILFEMLAGRPPYTGTMGVIMGQILGAPVPLASEFRPNLDCGLVEVCRRAMSKDVADRFTNMEELARAIDGYLKTADSTSLVADSTPAPLANLQQEFPDLASTPLTPISRKRRATKLNWYDPKLAIIVGGGVLSVILLIALIVMLNNGKKEVSDVNPRESQPVQIDPLQQTHQQHPVETGQPAAQPGDTEESKWISLLDGNSLDNWVNQRGGPAGARVVDDYLELIPGGGGLMTKEWFGPAYELETEFYIPIESDRLGQARGNSGIFLNGRFEIQILDSHKRGIDPKKACGALYDQIGPSAEATLPANFWQTMRIIFRAPVAAAAGTPARKGELTVVVNGTTVIDRGAFDKVVVGGLGKDLAPRGPIFLQDHGSPVRFRKMRIKPITKPDESQSKQNESELASATPSSASSDFVSLFNGQNLTGWNSYGGPKWTWSNGRLVGSGNGAGFLINQATFYNFELELQYRLAIGAGSGVFLRAHPTDDVSGGGQLEVQIIDDQYSEYAGKPDDRMTGAVFGVFPRKVTPTIKRNDWNTLRVRLEGRHIQVWVNGTQTVDANIDDARDKFAAKPALSRTLGHIALQQNQASDVEFRELKIKQLP